MSYMAALRVFNKHWQKIFSHGVGRVLLINNSFCLAVEWTVSVKASSAYFLIILE